MRRRTTAIVATGIAILVAGGWIFATREEGGEATLTQVAPSPAEPVVSSASSPVTPVPSPSPTRAHPPSPKMPTRSPRTSPRPARPDPARPPGSALPTGCLSYTHACAYPDATGAVTGGVSDFDARRAGPTSVRVTWRSENLAGDSNGGPVVEFVVGVWRGPWDANEGVKGDPSRLRRIRVSRGTFAVTVDGLVPGERYAFWAQELNSSGLSPAAGVVDVVIPAASPSPTATPTASPSA